MRAKHEIIDLGAKRPVTILNRSAIVCKCNCTAVKVKLKILSHVFMSGCSIHWGSIVTRFENLLWLFGFENFKFSTPSRNGPQV